MQIPAWWSTQGSPKIAGNRFGIDEYELEWECDLRQLHGGHAGERNYFNVSYIMRLRVDGKITSAGDIRYDALDLFSQSGNSGDQFLGMSHVLEGFMEEQAKMLIQAGSA